MLNKYLLSWWTLIFQWRRKNWCLAGLSQSWTVHSYFLDMKLSNTTHIDFFHSENSKNLFRCLASKIDSILSNYNYKRCLKARKIEKGQKILKTKTKAGYGKNLNFHNFFSFLGLIGHKKLMYFWFSRT